MGRIVEYVVLLSNLSLVLGAQQYLKSSQATSYEREKQANLSLISKQYFPKDQNAAFGRKVLPVDLQTRRRALPSKQMLSSAGLHAYAYDDFERAPRKRNLPERNPKFPELSRTNVLPTLSQSLYPRRNSKNFYNPDFPSQKLSKLTDHNYSFNHPAKGPNNFNKQYQDGRNARYHTPKICDPCNSVPWVPLIKVSDSYRHQRTHITELHPTSDHNFNFDYHAYASNTHNLLLPPVPLAPPIYDTTISSSFGLPVGNIPTSHGLLAPISHLPTEFNKYAIDYSSSFNYYSPHGLLDNNNFPELSPVSIVPIHDSAQFYQFDSTIPDLVPPPTKDVSNVVLTISEEQQPAQELPPNHKNPDAVLSSESNALDHHVPRPNDQNRTKDHSRLEIVKSIPLAEFISAAHFPQQQLPLYPPLQSEFPTDKTNADHSASDFSFLVPPPKKPDDDLTFTSNKSADQITAHAIAPKPLTSPSLSWLFSDHTASPSNSKTTASVTSFATDKHQIASVVNNELRPVSPLPLLQSPLTERSLGLSKTKKIQIIIPYTTKTKNGHDNNALESVQHEVFQPPLIQSTNRNNSPHDFATSALPPSTEASQDSKVIDRTEAPHNPNAHGYLTEMHHIIATNIRELLREEIQKSHKDQNYPLQNNIDNWTALEYSNHKTLPTKAPKEIIAQALAVTSIPGTSISHLLLPSKKIPNEYLATTPTPTYDEPSPTPYKPDNSTVNSRPFTAKPYATTNLYKGTKDNHDRNYTHVDRGKVNVWGRLNENLLVPEPRSRTRPPQQTTASTWPDSLRPSDLTSEKVQIVTPVPLGPQTNHTTAPFRRTTRHASTTETPTAAKPPRNPLFLNKLNSTRLEKVSNLTSPSAGRSTENPTTVSTPRSTPHSAPHSAPYIVPARNVSLEETAVETATAGKPDHFSINDIFPFRNKELPWESAQNGDQPPLRIGRQRKSLIKQANLQRPKAVVGSS